MASPAPRRPLPVAIHAALDPAAAGGVQTNLLSLVRNLAGRTDDVAPILLAPPSVSEAWSAIAGDGTTVARWKFIMPWYREREPLPLKQRLIEAVATRLKPGMAQRDRDLRDLGARVLHFPYQLAFDTSLPSVYEPWDLQHIHLPHLFSPGECAWRTQMYARACRRAALVVTATATTKRDLVTSFGIPAEKIAVILRDSDLGRDAPPPERRAVVLRDLGIEGDFAFYPAMTFPHKNHARLFEALAILRQRHGLAVPLVCSGRVSDAHQAGIAESLERCGVGDLVHFVGSLSEEALVSLFAQARLLAFPSLFEGLGLPLLEAMQYGLPIVAARASCIPEVTAEAAVLFDPDDPADMAQAIRRVWTDADLRGELTRKGYARRRDFAWSTAIPTYVAAYRKAAGDPLTEEEAHHLSHALSTDSRAQS